MKTRRFSFGPWAGALTIALSLPAAAQAAEGAVACYDEAKRQPSISDFDAIRLCRDADSTAPADCYVEAREQTFLSSYDALRLCTFARSTAPAECAAQAEQETSLSHEEVLRLCGRMEFWGYP